VDLLDRRSGIEEVPTPSIRITPLRALNRRPLLEEERKTPARADYFSV